jgi:hypothetical protein
MKDSPSRFFGARLPPPATVLPRISRIAMAGAGQRGKSMTDQEPPLTFTFGTILRMAIIVSLLWIIGDTLDGGSESFIGVPLLVAAWLCVFVALDRWVSKHADQN